MNSTTYIIRKLKIMGGKIRASMTVIIEKDQNTTDVFELRVYNDTKKEKKNIGYLQKMIENQIIILKMAIKEKPHICPAFPCDVIKY